MRGLLLLFSCGALTIAPLAAHTVLTDGTIGLTMHIDPDDAPVAARPSRFELRFKDLSGRLDIRQCDGTFQVTRRGTAAAPSQILFPPGTRTAVSTHEITFPAPGVYTVIITGAPRGTARFPPFRWTFDVRVSGDGALFTAGPDDPLPTVAGAVLAVSLLLCWGFWPRSRDR